MTEREVLTAEELALIEGMLASTAGNIKNNIKRYGWKSLAAKVGRMREQANGRPAAVAAPMDEEAA